MKTRITDRMRLAKTDKGLREKTENNKRGHAREGAVIKDRAYSEEYTNTVQLMTE
jgi:hypothetical protein